MTSENLEKHLQSSSYSHRAITLEPSPFELEQNKLNEERQKAMGDSPLKSKTMPMQSPSKKGRSSAGLDDDHHEEEFDEFCDEASSVTSHTGDEPSVDEDFKCKIFYKENEIEKVKNKQRFDHFHEIRQLKQKLAEEEGINATQTKIKIEEYAPKKEEVKKLGGSLRKSRTSRRIVPEMGGEGQPFDMFPYGDEEYEERSDGHQSFTPGGSRPGSGNKRSDYESSAPGEPAFRDKERNILRSHELKQLKVDIDGLIVKKTDEIKEQSSSQQSGYSLTGGLNSQKK